MGIIRNSVSFGSGLNIEQAVPIDSRMRVETVADLTTVWNDVSPSFVGMVVAVMATGDLYVLTKEDATKIANWKQIGTASSEDLSNLESELNSLKEYVGEDESDGLGKKIADNAAAIATKQDKLTAGEAITITSNTIDVKVDGASDNALTKSASGLKVTIPEADEYIIATAAAASTGAVKSYELRKNGSKVGVSIDIPKDLVVTSGEVFEATGDEGADLVPGDLYLKLVIGNSEEPVYIAVKDLTDVYTAGAYLTLEGGQFSINYTSLKSQILQDVASEITDDIAQQVDDLEGSLNELENQVGALDCVEEVKAGSDELSVSTSNRVATITLDAAAVANSEDFLDALKEQYTGNDIKLGTEVTSDGDTLSYDDDTTIAEAIQGVVDEIEKLSASNFAISAGDHISITGSTTKQISVNTSSLVAENSSLAVGSDGKLNLVWVELN